MVHTEVYKIFEAIFPQFTDNTKEWFPNGKNSVRIRQKYGQDYVFTYDGKKDWRFETVESFLKRMKGGRGMNVRLHDSISS